MRPITSSYLLLAIPGFANAHTLAGGESTPVQIGHQLLGLHHLPVTAVTVIVGILIFRLLSGAGLRVKRHTQ